MDLILCRTTYNPLQLKLFLPVMRLFLETVSWDRGRIRHPGLGGQIRYQVQGAAPCSQISSELDWCTDVLVYRQSRYLSYYTTRVD